MISPVLTARTISILCSHSLQCDIIINSHLGEGCFPHHRMQWRFIATISKKRRGGLQRPREMEIVHIHHMLLGCYCLALSVRRGGWDKQRMTNVENCKWVSGNLLRRGQESRLCCTLQYVLWTVRMLDYVPFHQVPKNLTCRLWTKHYVMKDLFWFAFFFFLFVCLSSCWLPDCQADSGKYPSNH